MPISNVSILPTNAKIDEEKFHDEEKMNGATNYMQIYNTIHFNSLLRMCIDCLPPAPRFVSRSLTPLTSAYLNHRSLDISSMTWMGKNNSEAVSLFYRSVDPFFLFIDWIEAKITPPIDVSWCHNFLNFFAFISTKSLKRTIFVGNLMEFIAILTHSNAILMHWKC